MIDSHCHLNFEQYEKDLDEVIKRAFEAGVSKIINVGTNIEYSQKAVELAQKYENLYAIVGVHPHDAVKLKPDWKEQLEELIMKPKVVGIGEIGLDYYSYQEIDPKIQKEVFRKQVEMAVKHKLPLQIHQRHAGNDVLQILEDYKNELVNPPGMFHCMSGNLDFLAKVLSSGFYVGFDGNITYKGLAPGETMPLSELVKAIPMKKLIVETDAPFLSPVPHRGSRNEPAYVIIVADFIAKLKNLSFDKVASETEKNTLKVFNLL